MILHDSIHMKGPQQGNYTDRSTLIDAESLEWGVIES